MSTVQVGLIAILFSEHVLQNKDKRPPVDRPSSLAQLLLTVRAPGPSPPA